MHLDPIIDLSVQVDAARYDCLLAQAANESAWTAMQAADQRVAELHAAYLAARADADRALQRSIGARLELNHQTERVHGYEVRLEQAVRTAFVDAELRPANREARRSALLEGMGERAA